MTTSRKERLIRRYYPVKAVHPFRSLLEEAIRSAPDVLDAGCGDGNSFRYSMVDRRRPIVGVDLLWRELIQNKQVALASVGDLERLPFASQSFDLVFSHDVVEHLRRPRIALAEISRVLRPGGKLMLLTPNSYHYFALAGRLVPHALQVWIARELLKSPGEVFRTYYRCNSARRIAHLSVEVGLRPIDFRYYEPSPTYLAVSPFTFFPALVYERLVNKSEKLAVFRAQLIGVCQKIEGGKGA